MCQKQNRICYLFINFSVIWGSKLMPKIALSTMEAEYNTLSFCMKQVLPFQRTIKAISQGIGISSNRLTTFRTTVWEDNSGALTLAKMEPGRVTTRSKHYMIKYHWFRQFTHSRSSKRFLLRILTLIIKRQTS